MKETRQYIYQQIKDRQLSVEQSKIILKEIKQAGAKAKDIAVIGMSGRFPGAANLDEYWRNLQDEIDCIADFPESRHAGAQDFIRQSMPGSSEKVSFAKGGYLDDIAGFDAGYFKISHKEAELMDPVQRLLLTTAMEAAEDAGYGGKRLTSTQTGVFIGRDHTVGNMYTHLIDNSDELSLTGSYTGILASRISYFLDLTGPSVVVDTACSAGLVAIHNACQAIRNGECHMAFAGGVSLIFCPVKNPAFDLVESGLNVVKPFDKDADGTMWGEGIGAVLLKPLDKALADRDSIHAVIKGTAANNDGKSNGITAPNAAAQEEVFTRAWADAGIPPQTISYVEAHGTGTILGDPIEISALTNAFKRATPKRQFCGIGSVKSSIGHLAAASGIASLLKVILSLKHQKLISSLHFDNPNPFIEFARSPVYLVDKVQDWPLTAEHPRRAGVSAFGFSGTNCHIVVEEAPDLKEISDESLPTFLLIVSARDSKTMYELLRQYHELVSRHDAANLADICYTSAVGRGHYNCRLAIMAGSKEELLSKLYKIGFERLLNTSEQDGIYYHEFRMVPDSKKERFSGELIERERQQLSEQFLQLASDSFNQPEGEEHFLTEACRLYVQGAEADWSFFYRNMKFRSVPLPVYPFTKDVCWPKSPEPGADQIMLPGKTVLQTYQQDIYEMKLKEQEHWFIQEHRMMGLPIVPAAAWIEWARAAGEKYYGHSCLQLSDVHFSSPLIVQEPHEAIVHTLLEQRENQLHFSMVNCQQEKRKEKRKDWVLNAEGIIRPLDPNAQPPSSKLDIDSLLQANEWTPVEADFSRIAGRTLFGRRWHNIRQLTRNTDHILIHVSLEEAYLNDFNHYLYHPALLDTALNGVAMFILGEPYLPFSVKHFSMYGPMPSSFYSFLRRKEYGTNQSETVTYDISLADEQGNVFAEAENYTLKRVQSAQLGQSLLYRIRWTRSDRTEASSASAAPVSAKSTILFGAEQNQISRLASLLEAEGEPLIRVERGQYFQRIAERHYRIGDDAADYVRLFADLQRYPISRLIHGFTFGEAVSPADLAELSSAKSYSIRSLFNLVQALVQAKTGQAMDIVLLTSNASVVTGQEHSVQPLHTALVNLGKVVNTEHPNLICRTLDVDEASAWETMLPDLLAPREAYQAAYRHNERYVEQLVPWATSDASERLHLRRDEVYLITGGTGGMGLELAKHLASQERILLVLLSRRGCPPRQEWEWIKQEATDHKAIHLIGCLEEIERLGSKVEVHACDVTKEEELRPVLRHLERDIGPIRGIIHAAGITGNGYLYHKSWQEFESVTGPKIEGSYLLIKLLDQHPDFFVSCSSVATLEGSPGQSDYVTGNGYLDGFASYLRTLGIRGITLNWSAWAETGMALQHNAVHREGLFRPLRTNEAIAAFQQAMDSRGDQWFIGAVNEQTEKEGKDKLYVRIGQELQPDLRSSRANARTEHAFQLSGRTGGHEEDMEHRVARIWSETLHLETIHIYDSFLDLGGDSLIATQLIKKLNLEFPGLLDLPDLFSYPSVFQLAEYITRQQAEIAARQSNRELNRNPTGIQQKDEDQQGNGQTSDELLKQKLLSVLDQVTSGDQTIEDAVQLLSQRRKTTDD